MKTEAKTFTVTYDPREDRLKLILNYEFIEKRCDYWITRNFLLKLLPVLMNYSQQSKHRLINLHPESELKKEPLLPTDNALLELTQTSPSLLDQVHFNRLDDGNIQINFAPTQGIHSTAVVSPAQIEQIRQMLIQSAPSYDWGIGPWWE